MKAGGEVAYNRTTVSLPAMNGRKEGSEGRRRGRGKKFKKKEKKGRKNRMSQGCLVRFHHREGLILDRLNTMGIQSPFFPR